MTSEELRRIVLKQFYDRRTTEYFTPMHALVCEVVEGNLADICDQLAKDGLIDWYRSASHPESGSGRITERGVNVIEEVTRVGSGQTDYIRKLIAVVDHSNASEQEKKKAKVLLENLASNGLVMVALETLLRGGSAR